jgi:hypothetical protein
MVDLIFERIHLVYNFKFVMIVNKIVFILFLNLESVKKRKQVKT